MSFLAKRIGIFQPTEKFFIYVAWGTKLYFIMEAALFDLFGFHDPLAFNGMVGTQVQYYITFALPLWFTLYIIITDVFVCLCVLVRFVCNCSGRRLSSLIQ
jgi:hypothetical protein